jgi:long-chain acyl-CoA synthetase
MHSTESRELDIHGSLQGERIFITGATGFVGKVLVEKLLWSIPEVDRLLLLVRPSAEAGAEERVAHELLASPLMARLRARHGEDWPSWAAGKLEVVSGDLSRDRLGLDAAAYGELCLRVDRVVAAAATVRFDERLDLSLELNARGALRTLRLAQDAGDAPLLHLSTCFVGGRRLGSIQERIADVERLGPAELAQTMAALDEQCERAAASEERLVRAGRRAARELGFNDVYTLTKSLAERLLARDRGRTPVSIVRPAIVESAAAEPIPGWIETVRVADPLLVAYGRGRTRQIPGDPEAQLELVPVDLVVNCALAALAELGRDRNLRIYQLGSARNPIRLGELLRHAREGFAKHPLQDQEGNPTRVERAHFVEPSRLERSLERRRRRARAAGRLLKRLGAGRQAARLGSAERVLSHFSRLIDVYRPYLRRGASFDDEATRGLWSRLTPLAKTTFPFDIEAIDWRSYIPRTHVPGLVRFALRAESGAPPPSRPETPRAERRARAASRANAASSLVSLLDSAAREAPDTPALQTFRDGRWLRYTYAQAVVATTNIARALANRYGISRGDRVVLWSGGRPEWVLTMFALHRLGAVTVPLDPQWPTEEVEQAGRHVRAKLICAAPELAATLADSETPVAELAEPFVPAPDVGQLADRLEIDPEVGEGDLATIVFTSGTTVAPKAVPLTHGNLLANVRALVPLMDLSRDRLLSVLPIHHVFELMVGLLVPLAGASTISYVSEVKPAEISWMMAQTRPTVLVAVPKLLELLHNGIRQSVRAGGPGLERLFRVLFALSRASGGRLGHRLFGKVHQRFGGSLRRLVTGGSALEPGLARSFQLMGFQVAEGYGMTETSPVLTVNPWGKELLGSVGRPLPSVEIELRGGQIWVRGPNVMSGYLDNPEATREVMADGWLDTGDLGHLDDRGYLHISGRSKEVIVTAAGKNVYPEEVELRYRGLPGVEELVVLGLPAAGGAAETVSAVIVPSPGAGEAEIEKIREAVANRSAALPSYQRISRIELWLGELPKTTTLKVKRQQLRERVLTGGGPTPVESQSPPAAAPALTESEEWVVETLARLTRTRPDLLRPATRLAEVGVDSLTRVELVGELEAYSGQTLDEATAASLTSVADLFGLAHADPTPEPTHELREGART